MGPATNRINIAIDLLAAQRDTLPDGPAKDAVCDAIADLQGQRSEINGEDLAAAAAAVTGIVDTIKPSLKSAQAGVFDPLFQALGQVAAGKPVSAANPAQPAKAAAVAPAPAAPAPTGPGGKRDFFARPTAGSLRGSLIEQIQTALNRHIPIPIATDSDFGPTTERTLRDYQTSSGLPPTGRVSAATWQSLIQTPEPPIFDRCLQLTAAFEGTGFTKVVGNFDKAGITWGIIGFTLAGGELGLILTSIEQQKPGLIAQVFGADAATILRITGPQASAADQTAWANSVSTGGNNYQVIQPWLGYFAALGDDPTVQAIQIARARDKYWRIATDDAASLGLTEELDYLICFDTAVQNGGMGGKDRLAKVQAAFAEQQPASAQAKRVIIAQIIASTAENHQQDVLDRKMAIATGAGTIHQDPYRFADWGFLDGYVPTLA